jgi:hypothetical protein
MTNNRNETAVSEILGAMLLLFIVVTAFSLIYFYINSDSGPAPQTYVHLIGSIDGENVTLKHMGGESLDGKDPITFNVAGEKQPYLIKDWLLDSNSNGKWDFGEQILYHFDVLNHLDRLDQYEFIGVQAIDDYSNAIDFQGPVSTDYVSDVGLSIKINNSFPEQGQRISIILSAWCLRGDFPAAGGVKINCTLPEGLEFIGYVADQGTYNNASGIWNLGNLLVENSPVNLTIEAQVNAIPYHEPTQLGLVFEGSEYTSGSVSVWQNTYLSGLRFALNDETIFPHDGSVELTVVTCGGESLPLAEVALPPTIITESNYHPIGQDLRNTPYPGGYAPLSSAIRLVTDRMSKSPNFQKEKEQLVLIVSSGNPDCVWDETLGNGYGARVSSDKNQVHMDTITAKDYLHSQFDFNSSIDELNAITVAKTVEFRNSSFLNASIVLPPPGAIYNRTNPVIEPGWVYEVEPGKDAFQEAFSTIIKMLLNKIEIKASVVDSTTIDPNPDNNYYMIYIQPRFV